MTCISSKNKCLVCLQPFLLLLLGWQRVLPTVIPPRHLNGHVSNVRLGAHAFCLPLCPSVLGTEIVSPKIHLKRHDEHHQMHSVKQGNTKKKDMRRFQSALYRVKPTHRRACTANTSHRLSLVLHGACTPCGLVCHQARSVFFK